MYLIRGNIVPMPKRQAQKKEKKRRKNKLKQVWVSNIVEHLATRNNTQPHTTQMERPEPGFLYLLNVLNLNGACLKRSVVEADPSQPKM